MSDTLPMPIQRGFALIVALALALGAMVPLVAPAATQAVSTTLTVSQVYGGGGNSGATYTHDFIELYNLTNAPIDLSALSLQYASATGTGNFGANSGQLTELSGSIPAGGHFLVQEGTGGGGMTPLPSPDLVDASPINMSGSAGKVALVTGTDPLGCNGGSTPCDADQLARIVDLVGWGSANFFEGSDAAPGTSNSTAVHRDDDGATDSDDNAEDFTAGPPNPRNSGSAGSLRASGSADPSSVEPGATTILTVVVETAADPVSSDIAVAGDLTSIGYEEVQAFTAAEDDTFTFDATVAVDTSPGAKSLPITVTDAEERSVNLTIPLTVEAPIEIVPIGFVQGSVADADDGLEHRSAFAPANPFSCSDELFTIQGVVTQRIQTAEPDDPDYGFFVQNTVETDDAIPDTLDGLADDDPNSSDGLFVYTSEFTTTFSDDPDVGRFYSPEVGDEIVLRGRVAEFFNLTQFCNGGLLMLDLVAEDRLGATEITEADPADDLGEANRFWERHEGMRFHLAADSQVVAGRSVFASTADAEVWVIRGDHPVAQREDVYASRVFRDPHPLDDAGPAGSFDNGNGYRIMLTSHGLKWLEDDPHAMLAPARTFDTVTNEITGSLYFSFGKYAIEAEQQLELVNGADPSGNAPPAEPDREIEYSTAVYNVENLYDFRDDPFDGCDFAGNAGCTGVDPPFDYVPASDEAYQGQLADLADQIAVDLHGPDILLIQEAEDQDICTVTGGAFSCGDVDDADGKPDTLQELAVVIEAAYGIAYDAAYDRDGADDRGIVNGFLYRTDRVELLEADASHPVLGSEPQVDYRSDPLAYNADVQNPKALNAVLPGDVDTSTGQDGPNVFTRPGQVGHFRVWRDGIGTSVFTDLYAITNHFSSGPDGRVGQRTEQAAYNAAIVEALASADDGSRVVVGGDFNVFPRPDDPFAPGHPLFPSDQLAPLYEVGLRDLWAVVVAEAPESAYSYNFEGQAQTLDNQFTTDALFEELNGVRFAHINADFPAEYDGDGSRGSSDHDPQAARFDLATADALVNLVEWLLDDGAIDPSKAEQLLSRLERVDELAAAGAVEAAGAQVQAFGNQVDGLSPRWIEPAAAEILQLEAEVLASDL